MEVNTPKGVILKSFDLDTYPVLIAVAVRTHSVIPVNERVSVASVYSRRIFPSKQSPDFPPGPSRGKQAK